MDSFDRLLSAVKSSKYKLYLIVDEYDSFANKLIFSVDPSVKDSGLEQSILRDFGDMVKSGSSGPITRMFFTGIASMAFCDALSGLNMVSDISFDPAFSSVVGLSEVDVSRALEKLELNDADNQDHMAVMKKHFNGYRFAEGAEGVYNPQAC